MGSSKLENFVSFQEEQKHMSNFRVLVEGFDGALCINQEGSHSARISLFVPFGGFGGHQVFQRFEEIFEKKIIGNGDEITVVLLQAKATR